MNKLILNHIKNCTDSGSFSRGQRYSSQQRVNNFYYEQPDVNTVIIESSVQGSRGFPYEQHISLVSDQQQDVQIGGNCSCPVGYNCKHVVAACFEYLTRQTASDPRKTNDSLSWLSNFITAGQQVDETADHRSEFIVYILNSTGDPAILSVEFKITRHLKKGGLGKPRQTDVYNFTADYLCPAYASDSDREIGKIISAQQDITFNMYHYNISGELGFMALSKIIKTGRCFWQDLSKPALQYDQARDLMCAWIELKKGASRLSLSVEPKAILLDTMPALYLDTDNAKLGPIQGVNFNTQQWSLLLQAPIINKKDKTQFSQQLLLQLPEQQVLPTPQPIDTIDITQQTPVPQLFLFSDSDPRNQQHTYFMRLRFTYANHEIIFTPIAKVNTVLNGNNIMRITRDLDTEKQALAQLTDAQFTMSIEPQHGDIFFTSTSELNAMESILNWQHFIEQTLPELEQQGWQIKTDPSFNLQFIIADDFEVEIESDNDWFDLRFDLDINGQKVPLLPLIASVMQHYELDQLPENILLPLPAINTENQFLTIPSVRIKPICDILYELFDSAALDENGAMRLNRFDANRLAELEENCNDELVWRGGKAMRNLGRKLKNFTGIKNIAPPRGLKTDLRDYQQHGLNWLQFLREYQFNGILADDMGLGKTVQALAHLLIEKQRKRLDIPCLILAPTSLMSNWRREAAQFTPKLSVLILQGSDRQQHFDSIPDYDLIISTYPLLVRDQEILLAHEYHYFILDEAQVIKNPRAKAAQVARKINARHRLCITGTPMENHLGELWSLFDFLMPGFLGDTKSFKQLFRNPIEKYGDDEQRKRLVRRTSPFLMRRSKSEVADELPAKTEIIRSITLESKQAALYESIRLSMEKKVRDAIASKGLARSHITILDALLKLRQVCCDPQLLSLAQAKKVKESAKLGMLMEMVIELVDEGRRILLFSQFTKMLAIIEQQFKEHNIRYSKLTGQTRNRDDVIEKFRQGEADVFLISLKAGGVGLNLTEADTVIHYDPWWNPAVENQATDRAHRIGQDKSVFVYKLITENTLEEKIVAMQAKKQALADGVYNKSQTTEQQKLSADDLKELFAPLTN